MVLILRFHDFLLIFSLLITSDAWIPAFAGMTIIKMQEFIRNFIINYAISNQKNI